MTYKIYERREKISKKGVPLIFIVQVSGKPYKIPTGLFCAPGSWDQAKQTVRKTDPKSSHTNPRLDKLKVKMNDLIEAETPIDEIRLAFKNNGKIYKPIEKKIDIPNILEYDKLTAVGKQFYRTVEGVIHSHASDWSDGYKKRFRSVRTKILAYEPDFTVELLSDENWWRGFVTHCLENLANISNTISSDTSTIEALKKELGIEGPKFEWSYIEPDVQGLSWDKVLLIRDVNLDDYPKATVKDSRTLWIASAFTGRRWSEISEVGPSNFYQRKGQWRYKNIGKGQKPVDLPLLPEAVEFFKKIKFTLPKLAGQTVNEDIKIIGRVAGLKDEILVIKPLSASKGNRKEVKLEYQTLHFHTARHSYCHHIVEKVAGRPHAEKLVAFLLGHASYQTTWKYMNRAASSNEQMFESIFHK